MKKNTFFYGIGAALLALAMTVGLSACGSSSSSSPGSSNSSGVISGSAS